MKSAQIAEGVKYEGVKKGSTVREVTRISEQGEVTYLENGRTLKCPRREFAEWAARPYRDPNTRKPKEERQSA